MSTSPSPSPKLVLVTGANGYLASATVQHFLEHGYHVRGTVRSLHKAEGLKAALYPQYESALSFVVIDDMTRAGVYEQAGALDGVDAVCHVASPVPDISSIGPAASTTTDVDWVRDMVNPARDGTLTILRAASKYPRISHISITSSVAAMQGMEKRSTPETASTLLTEADWNTAKADDAANRTNPLAAYFASKTVAEQAAWSYVKHEEPHYVVATFCPPFFMGPAGGHASSAKEFGSSLGLVYTLTLGQPPAYSPNGSFINVRDIAQAFRLVIEKPLAQSERFLLAAGAQTTTELVAFATSGDPSVLKDIETQLDTNKVRRVLGWVPRSKHDTFVDMLRYLKEQEKHFIS